MESKDNRKNVQRKSKRTQLKRQVNFLDLTPLLQIESTVRSDENKTSHPKSTPQKYITIKKKCWVCNKEFEKLKITQNSSSQEKTVLRQTITDNLNMPDYGPSQLKKKMRNASTKPVLQAFLRDTSTKKHTEVKPIHKVFTSRMAPYNVSRMSQIISCLAELQIEKYKSVKCNLNKNPIAATSDPQVEDESTNDTSASTGDEKTKVTQICDESDKLEIAITSDDKDVSDVPSQSYLQLVKEQETVDNTDKKNQQNDKSNKKAKKHSNSALTINKALKDKTTQQNDKSSKAPQAVASNPGTSIPPKPTTSKDKVKPKKFESAWLLGPKIIDLPPQLKNSPYLQSVMPKRNGTKKF